MGPPDVVGPYRSHGTHCHELLLNDSSVGLEDNTSSKCKADVLAVSQQRRVGPAGLTRASGGQASG